MSTFNWTEKATEEGGTSEKIPAGQSIPVTISKVVYGKKGGAPFKSSKGDPQIMVIFTDERDREAAQIITLSDKAAWVLARLLHRFGCDTDALNSEGVLPKHFAEPAIGNAKLIGLRGRIDLTYNEQGYADCQPCEVDANGQHVPSGPPKADSTIEADDLPF